LPCLSKNYLPFDVKLLIEAIEENARKVVQLTDEFVDWLHLLWFVSFIDLD